MPAAGGGRHTPDKASGYAIAPDLVALLFGNKSCPKKSMHIFYVMHIGSRKTICLKDLLD
jgi:hypothetical protein